MRESFILLLQLLFLSTEVGSYYNRASCSSVVLISSFIAALGSAPTFDSTPPIAGEFSSDDGVPDKLRVFLVGLSHGGLD